ncbi:hypothetical protein E3N88_07674 [Mikania micrantha]|uniref:NB-ARC domain-containing protein n=1 Tax=Mikania micrantha TaxID=192012 RepID=A0A5N6PE22_9ASTR|nr:hypothetical protein E3N88_07674 [Mikania micrantha]
MATNSSVSNIIALVVPVFKSQNEDHHSFLTFHQINMDGFRAVQIVPYSKLDRGKTRLISDHLKTNSLQKLAPYNGIGSKIQTLQRSLSQIQCVLTDASEKETTNQSVKQWLHDLQHLAYDIDDVLDDLATDAMHRELTDAETHTSKSVTGVNKEFADLNLLQVDLRNHLREKRFILVLDDVWAESCEDWETLVTPFHACAPGSKIIMTTRKDNFLKKLGYNHLIQHLQCLSREDALSLVALHALGVNNLV